MLFELLYTSKSIKPMEQADMERLLEGACERNARRGITGLLVYDGGGFIQLIEGEQDDVEEVFAKISQDKRHTDINVFHRGKIDERAFGEWSMGYQRIDSTTGIPSLYEELAGGDKTFLPSGSKSLGLRLLRVLHTMGVR